MSTTLFAAISILAPIHALVRRCLASARPRNYRPPVAAPIFQKPPATRTQGQGMAGVHHYPSAPGHRHHGSRGAPTLRVLRVMEAGQTTSHGGRMLISGRMADVCAELDRLAAQEAALQTGL